MEGAILEASAGRPPLDAAARGAEPGRVLRPRALVIGAPEGLQQRLAGVLQLDVVAEDAARDALMTRGHDIVLVDGALPAPRIRELLAGLASAAGSPDARGSVSALPAVIVMAPPARLDEVEADLEAEADVVSAALGSRELLGRLRAALRLRGYVTELNRKNAELQALYGRLERMTNRMAEELRLAGNVQRSLLPPPLHHPKLEVASEFMPAREIGGDYYDLVPLGPDRLAFAIGDVMGKGVPAALLAANLKACLRGQLQAEVGGSLEFSSSGPMEELVGRVNRLFWEVTPKGLFASMFFGVFDLAAGTLEYVNAGHDYPLLIDRSGAVRELSEGGTVLGIVERAAYQRACVAVDVDDLLVFYSDGVTDRGNAAGEAYGLERLRDAAVRSRNDPARIILYTLLGEVQGWSSGCPAEDDMTLVAVKAR
jgi:serine phosphatase RsbU (regulator of sigma subunit)